MKVPVVETESDTRLARFLKFLNQIWKDMFEES